MFFEDVNYKIARSSLSAVMLPFLSRPNSHMADTILLILIQVQEPTHDRQMQSVDALAQTRLCMPEPEVAEAPPLAELACTYVSKPCLQNEKAPKADLQKESGCNAQLLSGTSFPSPGMNIVSKVIA